MAKLALGVVLAGAVFASAATQQVAARQATGAERCRVSNTSSHPAAKRPSFNFGNARIAVDLPEGARFAAVPDGSARGGWAVIQKDGLIRTKLGWFTIRGTPRVTGRRVDGTGRQLRSDVGPLSYSSSGPFYPSLLYFPSFGCWRVTAAAGGAHLSAIVNVTR
ncbi:hypothetical protein [Gaiella occulta]|uniref:hypothetical protein n=1 Tax=Gaiella occulta TaxID=1002870 RepID=UPI0011C0619D|nr:hypothetical protein [Gaiella occulta]